MSQAEEHRLYYYVLQVVINKKYALIQTSLHR